MMKAALVALVLFPGCILGSTTPVAGPGGGGYAGGGNAGSAEPAPAGGAAAPAGPVSVDIHSACPQEVRVFYGSDPGYSGTQSSVESNSIESKTFKPGDKMWIIDSEEHGLTSVTVQPGMTKIEIGADCHSLNPQ
jgi:hypothetical protein